MTRKFLNEHPISWTRGVMAGVLGALAMLIFVDIYNMLGVTGFSYEVYLGALLRGQSSGTHNWTVGFFANLVMGGIFGALYGYFFEFQFKAAGERNGVILGFFHSILAALFVFPFFNAVHEFMELPIPGAFDAETIIILFVGHLLFGATAGMIYGPVRMDRVRTRYSEPGSSGRPGDPEVITSDEDPTDARAV